VNRNEDITLKRSYSRLKSHEYALFEKIRKEQSMNMSDAGRLLFHLGVKAYQEAHQSPSCQ